MRCPSALYLCVLCHCMFSAPNIPLCFPKARNCFSLHILKCADPQLSLSVVNQYLWETKQMPSCIMCVVKRERSNISISLFLYINSNHSLLDLFQVPSQIRNGQLINCLHQTYLLVIWSFHRDLFWSFLTTELQRTQYFPWLSCQISVYLYHQKCPPSLL